MAFDFMTMVWRRRSHEQQTHERRPEWNQHRPRIWWLPSLWSAYDRSKPRPVSNHFCSVTHERN